jgi:RimJ/RimL family protein N-acetyltransferase
VSLQTPRLTFRRLDAGDVDNLLALDGDPEVMGYLEARPRTRVEIETEVLPDFLSYYERYDDFGYWAGETIADGAFIGWFGMHPVVPSEQWIDVWPESPDDSSVVSLGYRLRRSAWGHGYATECTGALIRRAVRRARRTGGGGDHDGGEHRVATRAGEGRPAAHPHAAPGVGRTAAGQ